jgi:Flp pilus assembly protein TadD
MKEESDRDAAQRAIAEALRLDREDASAHALAGKIALDAEEPAKAVEQLNDAIRLKPNLAEAHYSLSIAFKKLGRQEQARAELDAVRRLREQDPHPDDNPDGIRQMLFAGEVHDNK